MKGSLRSTFAALLAALAFACAGIGDRAGAADAERAHGPVLRRTHSTAAVAQRALALAFLHSGRPVLAGQAHGPGTPPRAVPGTQPLDAHSFAALHAIRRSAAGARIIHPVLRPPFARRLAAARDGTLSARSNGVPPPAAA